ncbi:hypothetical protein BGX28_005046 [Mortierella sp. GBA30]|nr:hypothetical protein BGX28_005046 [Mortierella sp. GBA30]
MNPNNNTNNNPAGTNTNHPAGGSGSFSDTLNRYAHEALEQAKVLGHKAQEQFSHAMGHQSHNPAMDTSRNTTQQTSTTMSSGTGGGAGTLNNQNAQGAFADVNQFNANANTPSANNQAARNAASAGQNAAANPDLKTSQGGL